MKRKNNKNKKYILLLLLLSDLGLHHGFCRSYIYIYIDNIF